MMTNNRKVRLALFFGAKWLNRQDFWFTKLQQQCFTQASAIPVSCLNRMIENLCGGLSLQALAPLLNLGADI